MQVFDKLGKILYNIDNSKEIARGGEGAIIIVNKNKVAKIYLPNVKPITEDRFNFLTKLDPNLFVKPDELLFDSKGKIIGFIMQYMDKNYVPLEALYNKNYCDKNLYTNKIKEKILNSLIKSLLYVHSLNIIIGDLSGLNIMVNNLGDIKFIDVDSYQTPNSKHSGKLLDDIRDYLYNGVISEKSDYFALSVCIFNIITFMHPFKGLHQDFPKLSERMINKLPVFIQDVKLKVPKCYEPISDSFIKNQYEKLYLDGDRFILSLKNIPVKKNIVITPTIIHEKELIVQNISSNQSLINSFFNEYIGFIESETDYRVYDVSQKGNCYLKFTLNRKEWKKIFVGHKNVIGIKNDRFYEITGNTASLELKNIKYDDTMSIMFNIDNNIVIIDDSSFYFINCDLINNNNISFTKNSVFGKGFTYYNGLIQNVSGKQIIYYPTKNTLSSFFLNDNIKDILQFNNVSIIKLIENNSIKYKYAYIDNLKINISNIELDNFVFFTTKGNNINDAIVFSPDENQIKLLRASDFNIISNLECKIINSDTRLHSTNSGIIAVNSYDAWLINKK